MNRFEAKLFGPFTFTVGEQGLDFRQVHQIKLTWISERRFIDYMFFRASLVNFSFFYNINYP
jgi:hypothetical protein